MKLSEIQIKNFRSIKSECIKFDYNCLVLIGKNEAGKSNILKAIAAVFGEYKVSNKDKRKRINNEKIDDYHVTAKIELSKDDFNEILNRFKTKYTNIECIVFKNQKTILDYIKSIFYNLLLRVKIANDEEIHLTIWKYSNDDNDDFILEKDIFLNQKILNTNNQGAKQNLQDIIITIAKEVYHESPYRCHYWQYNESFLLKNSVSIPDFTNNPSKYESLENIFILCNRREIKKEFTDALSQDGDYNNLLEQVSQATTTTFKKIWKDFKDTSIELIPNGTEINIKVVNQTKYSFEDRSDGFKKFISILLMLSTQVRSGKMGERDIVLIDEPDQSLYPTSAIYLRDELLKMAETTKVIYSTHSQYMIDSNCIDRHLVAEKKDDVTTIKKTSEHAPYSDDELLRRTIGTSIFECVQEKNIIFEGWLDKELFRKYCEFYKKPNDFKNIGIVYLGGISSVETLVQLLILANKKFIIVADSDQTSNCRRIKFSEIYKEYSETWLSYGDIVEEVSTMEDFITPGYISEIIKKEFSDFQYNNSKNAIQNIELAIKDDKEKKQKIKNEIINSIKKQDIKDSYKDFMQSLKEKLDNL